MLLKSKIGLGHRAQNAQLLNEQSIKLSTAGPTMVRHPISSHVHGTSYLRLRSTMRPYNCTSSRRVSAPSNGSKSGESTM